MSRKKQLLESFEKASKRIKRNSRCKVWQDGNHPVLLDTNESKQKRPDDLHNNPVGVGIVDEPEYDVLVRPETMSII